MASVGTTSLLAAVLLGDGRLPVGASSHSWGVEAAVRRTGLMTTVDLERFLRERLPGPGLVDAAAAALAAGEPSDPGDAWWDGLVAELDARVPSAAQRDTSDRLGRQLLRAARRLWPSPRLEAAAARDRLPQPVSLGLVGSSAGVAPLEVAALSLHGAATMAASAAVRLRGLDPVAAQVAVVEVHPLISALADQAAAVPDPTALPAGGSVVVDLLAEVHRHEEARLFAS
jgi:urease accessory protein